MVLENSGARRDFDSEGRGFWSLQARSFGSRLFGHFDMRKIILTLAVLYPAAALAQGTAPANPPTIGGRGAYRRTSPIPERVEARQRIRCKKPGP